MSDVERYENGDIAHEKRQSMIKTENPCFITYDNPHGIKWLPMVDEKWYYEGGRTKEETSYIDLGFDREVLYDRKYRKDGTRISEYKSKGSDRYEARYNENDILIYEYESKNGNRTTKKYYDNGKPKYEAFDYSYMHEEKSYDSLGRLTHSNKHTHDGYYGPHVGHANSRTIDKTIIYRGEGKANRTEIISDDRDNAISDIEIVEYVNNKIANRKTKYVKSEKLKAVYEKLVETTRAKINKPKTSQKIEKAKSNIQKGKTSLTEKRERKSTSSMSTAIETTSKNNGHGGNGGFGGGR